MTNFITVASIVVMLASGQAGEIQSTGFITENNVNSIVQTMDNSNYYPLTAKVTEVNRKENLISAIDFSGNVWTFSGNNYSVNDSVSMLMSSNGTEKITDDEVISASWAGWELFNWQSYEEENIISAELVKRVYDEENDIMVCTFKAVNGKSYTLYDFTAPYGSDCTLTLDYDGKVKSVSVTSNIENNWTK